MAGTEYRHEYKYPMSSAQIVLLRSRIEHLMFPDPNAGTSGRYSIRSLYFDSIDNRCYYENENGTEPREKFRIRIYNQSAERIMLECKRKQGGKVKKVSCRLTANQVQMILQNEFEPEMENVPPLFRKLELLRRNELYRPVVIVEYERIPFVYPAGNVRVTFDCNIASSGDVGGFFLRELPKRPVMPTGQHLMEVKFDEFLPDPIYSSLNLGTLQQTAYSKYYICRRLSLV